MTKIPKVLQIKIKLSDNREYVLKPTDRRPGAACFADQSGRYLLQMKQARGSEKSIMMSVEISLPQGESFAGDSAVELLISPDEYDCCTACSLVGKYWCRPSVGISPSDCPDCTQSVLLKAGAHYMYMLAVSGREYKSVIKGCAEGLSVRLFSLAEGLNSCRAPAIIIAAGENPYQLSQACTQDGMRLLETGGLNKSDRGYPQIFEYLGWCSWDAYQIRVSEEGLLQKCAELKEKNVPVRWILFDDMWGDAPGLNDIPGGLAFNEMIREMQKCTLNSFEADPERFPEGLAHAVRAIKSEYGMDVGIWHPTTGYWHGIKPLGEIAKRYAGFLCEGTNGQLVHGGEYESASGFYHSYHAFLKQCGAGFIKVDNQGFLPEYLGGQLPIGTLGRNVMAAIEDSAAEYFGGAVIHCMGMPAECWWNRRYTAVSRCSGDFMPENREWYVRHLMQCAYNSFYQGSMMYCDWDMWWTGDGQAEENALLHAVSGGPIYISDTPGGTNADILKPLTFSDGRILRCDRAAVPSEDCLTKNPLNSGEPFVIFNFSGDTAIAAAMNLDEKGAQVTGTIAASDFYDSSVADTYMIYEHFSGTYHQAGFHEKVKFSLADGTARRLYLILPVTGDVTPVGLTEKYISVRAVTAGEGNQFTLYEPGEFAFFARGEVAQVLCGDQNMPFAKKGMMYTARCENAGRLTVDVILKQK